MDARIRFLPPGVAFQDHLEGLQTARPAGERDGRHPGVGNGLEMDSRIPGGRGVNHVIEGHPVEPREGEQEFQVGPPLARFEA